MKILVLSDSHGQEQKINSIVSEHDFNHIIFLGDGITDLGSLINLPNLSLVRGNCDFFSSEKLEEVLELEGIKILITHGHTFGVKNGLGALLARAKEMSANVVFFGHTHIPTMQTINDITLINPGSLHKNRNGGSTFGVFTINNGTFTFNFVDF